MAGEGPAALRLRPDWVRVVLGGRIILLDPTQRIADLFWLNSDE
jgi:hypothetical protein